MIDTSRASAASLAWNKLQLVTNPRPSRNSQQEETPKIFKYNFESISMEENTGDARRPDGEARASEEPVRRKLQNNGKCDSKLRIEYINDIEVNFSVVADVYCNCTRIFTVTLLLAP